MAGRYSSTVNLISVICYVYQIINSTIYNVAQYLYLLISRFKSIHITCINISDIRTSNHTLSKVWRVLKAVTSIPVFGRCELDSHADTTVAGSNCVVLQYTGKECSVLPYSDTYAPTHNVPIVHAATSYQCQLTGQT